MLAERMDGQMKVKKCDQNWRQHRPGSLGSHLQGYEVAEPLCLSNPNMLGQQWGGQVSSRPAPWTLGPDCSL